MYLSLWNSAVFDHLRVLFLPFSVPYLQVQTRIAAVGLPPQLSQVIDDALHETVHLALQPEHHELSHQLFHVPRQRSVGLVL